MRAIPVILRNSQMTPVTMSGEMQLKGIGRADKTVAVIPFPRKTEIHQSPEERGPRNEVSPHPLISRV
jgi:hypothetical protein